MVSISDHDSIDANLKINEQTETRKRRFRLNGRCRLNSDFSTSAFTICRKTRAVELTKTLLDYTFNKENHTNEKLNEVFALLNSAIPEILVVLNHPLWDIEIVGKEATPGFARKFHQRTRTLDSRV
jgi:hypothetical protein